MFEKLQPMLMSNGAGDIGEAGQDGASRLAIGHACLKHISFN
jgi:hypothetical protein